MDCLCNISINPRKFNLKTEPKVGKTKWVAVLCTCACISNVLCMFSLPLKGYQQKIFILRHMSISYTTATLAKLSLAQANTISHHSPDSPLNVNAFPAPPNAKFPPRQSFSTPSVDMLRIPPWPAQTRVPAAPR